MRWRVRADIPRVDRTDKNEMWFRAFNAFYGIKHLDRTLVIHGSGALRSAFSSRARREHDHVSSRERLREVRHRRIL